MKERLDRMLINKDQLFSFQDVGVVHLPMFGFDHNPLWIRSGSCRQVSRQPKPFNSSLHGLAIKALLIWLGIIGIQGILGLIILPSLL